MALIICEVGQNHCGRMELARRLIQEAKKCGGDLVKFQLYDHKVLYKDHPEIPDVALTREQAFMLFEHGKKRGIDVFFSVFDVERVKWCEEMGVKWYKIAYSQRHNQDLLYALPYDKPIIISYGNESHCIPLSLYCIPKYPANPSDYRLSEAFTMRGLMFEGFSDHTIGLDAAKIALARGAKIIEKHFALTHEMGVDAEWSMVPSELRELKRFELVCKEVL